MNKRELANRLAKQAHKSRAKAADDVDSLVYGILKDMRQNAKEAAQPEPVEAPKPPAVSAPNEPVKEAIHKPQKGKV